MKNQLIFLAIGYWLWINTALAQPVVMIKGSKNPVEVEKQIAHHLTALNIHQNILLVVVFTKNIPRYLKGMTYCQPVSPSHDSIIHIRLDARLNHHEFQQKRVLAHEMVHVKQLAKRELVVINQEKVIWKGQPYHQKEYNAGAPWEKEAYRARRLLTGQDDNDHYTSSQSVMFLSSDRYNLHHLDSFMCYPSDCAKTKYARLSVLCEI